MTTIKVIFRYDYRYQIGDGIDACFFVIPELLKADPSLLEELKFILFISLFKSDSIDIWGNDRFSNFAINAIQHLWLTHEHDAESLLLGYLILSPKYLELIEKIRQESFENQIFNVSFDELLPRFIEENKVTLELLASNHLNIDDVKNIEDLELSSKAIALQLIPNDSNELCKILFINIVNSTAKGLMSEDRDNRTDFKSRNDFLEKYAYIVLAAPKANIPKLLAPFIQNFNSSEGTADFIDKIVLAQDQSPSYENFWLIWNLLQPKIIELGSNGFFRFSDNKIIKAYLFSQSWKESAKEWHTFKDRDKKFFKKMSIELASCKSTLYSIAKLLNC